MARCTVQVDVSGISQALSFTQIANADRQLGGAAALGYADRVSEATDEDLMLQYGGGDAAAFTQLYERHRGPLYRYLLRHAGEASTANDLYQVCWEKVISARKRYRAEAPFRAWLYRIAHNVAMDYFRSRRVTQELDPERIDEGNTDPLTPLLESERRQLFLTALEELPPEQRDALLLRLEAGFDVEAIARLTGVGNETAKSRLRYAVSRLKQVLQT